MFITVWFHWNVEKKAIFLEAVQNCFWNSLINYCLDWRCIQNEDGIQMKIIYIPLFCIPILISTTDKPRPRIPSNKIIIHTKLFSVPRVYLNICPHSVYNTNLGIFTSSWTPLTRGETRAIQCSKLTSTQTKQMF